ncbi:hypothetical protein TNCT_541951 [Trichonephila clavata]|uniref:Uncharacterized protein n=1 Tax=Trichonephila clavata TaxID=2740835 RepID=A0A8X6HBX7_TRICU|nr:hypothetical protein TNCT_541951 [Trichonephila clavata]
MEMENILGRLEVASSAGEFCVKPKNIWITLKRPGKGQSTKGNEGCSLSQYCFTLMGIYVALENQIHSFPKALMRQNCTPEDPLFAYYSLQHTMRLQCGAPCFLQRFCLHSWRICIWMISDAIMPLLHQEKIGMVDRHCVGLPHTPACVSQRLPDFYGET